MVCLVKFCHKFIAISVCYFNKLVQLKLLLNFRTLQEEAISDIVRIVDLIG